MNKDYHKILVIGSCGAGKSTLAWKLKKKLGLPLVHLDQYYWKPGWKRTPREEFRKKIARILEKENWIIDGNYRSSLDLRLPKADLVVFLNFPRLTCLWRVIKRAIKDNRVDKLDACDERITFDLVKWILWTFPQVNKREIETYLGNMPNNNQKVIKLRNNVEIANFLKNL